MSTRQIPTTPTPESQLKSTRVDLTPEEQLDLLMRKKALMVRRALMKVGDRFSKSAIARFAHSPLEQISRWSDPESRVAPSFLNMFEQPDAVVDAMMAGFARVRVSLGFAARRWVPAEDERAVDRTPALEAATAKAMAANSELAELVAEMRASRGGR